jgi:hypothetical protein
MSPKTNKNSKKIVADTGTTPEPTHTEPDVTVADIEDMDLAAAEAELAKIEAKRKALKERVGKQRKAGLSSKKLDTKRKWVRQNHEWLESAALRFAKRVLTYNQAMKTLGTLERDKLALPEKDRTVDKHEELSAPYQEALESLPKAIQDQAAEELKSNLS